MHSDNKKVIINNKNTFLSKKVCHKVSSWETCQQHSYKAFTSCLCSAQMIGGDIPLNVNFVPKTNHQLARQRHRCFRYLMLALFILQ